MSIKLLVTGLLACMQGAIAPGERAAHFSLARRLFGHLAEEPTVLRDGYAFRFAPDALPLLAQFVANERRCCPFITF